MEENIKEIFDYSQYLDERHNSKSNFDDFINSFIKADDWDSLRFFIQQKISTIENEEIKNLFLDKIKNLLEEKTNRKTNRKTNQKTTQEETQKTTQEETQKTTQENHKIEDGSKKDVNKASQTFYNKVDNLEVNLLLISLEKDEGKQSKYIKELENDINYLLSNTVNDPNVDHYTINILNKILTLGILDKKNSYLLAKGTLALTNNFRNKYSIITKNLLRDNTEIDKNIKYFNNVALDNALETFKDQFGAQDELEELVKNKKNSLEDDSNSDDLNKKYYNFSLSKMNNNLLKLKFSSFRIKNKIFRLKLKQKLYKKNNYNNEIKNEEDKISKNKLDREYLKLLKQKIKLNVVRNNFVSKIKNKLKLIISLVFNEVSKIANNIANINLKTYLNLTTLINILTKIGLPVPSFLLTLVPILAKLPIKQLIELTQLEERELEKIFNNLEYRINKKKAVQNGKFLSGDQEILTEDEKKSLIKLGKLDISLGKMSNFFKKISIKIKNFLFNSKLENVGLKFSEEMLKNAVIQKLKNHEPDETEQSIEKSISKIKKKLVEAKLFIETLEKLKDDKNKYVLYSIKTFRNAGYDTTLTPEKFTELIKQYKTSIGLFEKDLLDLYSITKEGKENRLEKLQVIEKDQEALLEIKKQYEISEKFLKKMKKFSPDEKFENILIADYDDIKLSNEENQINYDNNKLKLKFLLSNYNNFKKSNSFDEMKDHILLEVKRTIDCIQKSKLFDKDVFLFEDIQNILLLIKDSDEEKIFQSVKEFSEKIPMKKKIKNPDIENITRRITFLAENNFENNYEVFDDTFRDENKIDKLILYNQCIKQNKVEFNENGFIRLLTLGVDFLNNKKELDINQKVKYKMILLEQLSSLITAKKIALDTIIDKFPSVNADSPYFLSKEDVREYHEQHNKHNEHNEQLNVEAFASVCNELEGELHNSNVVVNSLF